MRPGSRPVLNARRNNDNVRVRHLLLILMNTLKVTKKNRRRRVAAKLLGFSIDKTIDKKISIRNCKHISG